MIHIKLDNEENQQKYAEALKRVGGKHPHYSPEYIDIFCGGISGLNVFVYEDKEKEVMIMLPGYTKEIMMKDGTAAYDFISPYGYSGPLTTANATEADVQRFWKEMDEWYLQHNYVSEFIRFSLNDNFQHYSGNVVPTLSNIKGKIIEEEAQWTNFDHKVRKNVKKAQREGLRVEIFSDHVSADIVEKFYDVYIHTMKRTNAAGQFFYTLEQFIRFCNNNPGQYAIVLVYKEDTVVSSELVLISDDSIYSFLGGTLEEYFDLRPNDLLKYEVINWGRNNGLTYFVLGGGYGQDDGIYRYKKSFFPEDTVIYNTGRKIIDPASYSDLVAQCNVQRLEKGLEALQPEDNSFFPLYRKLN